MSNVYFNTKLQAIFDQSNKIFEAMFARSDQIFEGKTWRIWETTWTIEEDNKQVFIKNRLKWTSHDYNSTTTVYGKRLLWQQTPNHVYQSGQIFGNQNE